MEKSTIVFIHGDTQNHTIFNNIARFFQSIGQNVLLLDLPGHGNESPYSKNHLEFLKMKLSHLTNPIICAHSSGGIFALDYILHTKNASSLILINALLSNPKLMDNSFDWESSFGNFRSLSKTLFKKQCLTDYSKFDNIGDDEISKMGLETTDPISLGRNIDFYLNLSADFIAPEDIKIPIVYVHSKDDKFIRKDFVEKKISQIKNARFFTIDSGHNSPIRSYNDIIKIIKENYSFIGLDT